MKSWLSSPSATPATAAHAPRRNAPTSARCLLATFVLAVVFSDAALAGDPCGAVMCLSQNKSAPQQCKGQVDDYFNIRVYHARHKYDPGATAARRNSEVTSRCSDARQEDKDFVQATYGPLEYYPYGFSNVSSGE